MIGPAPWGPSTTVVRVCSNRTQKTRKSQVTSFVRLKWSPFDPNISRNPWLMNNRDWTSFLGYSFRDPYDCVIRSHISIVTILPIRRWYYDFAVWLCIAISSSIQQQRTFRPTYGVSSYNSSPVEQLTIHLRCLNHNCTTNLTYKSISELYLVWLHPYWLMS